MPFGDNGNGGDSGVYQRRVLKESLYCYCIWADDSLRESLSAVAEAEAIAVIVVAAARGSSLAKMASSAGLKYV